MKSFFKGTQERIGIEWELLLVDQDNYELSNVIHPLLESLGPHEGMSVEAFQSCIEIKTPPVLNVTEAEADLFKKLTLISGRCQEFGIKLCSLGVHPFNLQPGKTTLDKRYLDFEKEYPFITRHHLTCSTQIHVSMKSGEEAIRVMRRLRNYLPIFTALSASSPFWHGERTGHVSFRQHLTRAAQNSGIPPSFHSWEEFESYFSSSKKAGFIQAPKDIHWDIRPRPDLGTLEFRVMDALPTFSENLAMCSLAHALITLLKRESYPLHLLRDVPEWAIKENDFEASHLGLKAKIIESNNKSSSLEDLAVNLCNLLEETSEKLGELSYLRKIRKMIQAPAYLRICQEYEKSHSMYQIMKNSCNDLFN